MHKVLKAFPCSFDGTTIENLEVGDERDFGSIADGLRKAGYIGDPDGKPSTATEAAAREAAERAAAEAAAKAAAEEQVKKEAEEAAAREAAEKAAEAAKADLVGKTNAQLIEIAKTEDISVETDDNKSTLVDKIVAGRAAKAAAQG